MAEPMPTKTVYAGRLMLQVPATSVLKNAATYEGSDIEVENWMKGFVALRTDIETKATALDKEEMKRTAPTPEAAARDLRDGYDREKRYAKTRLVGHSVDAASSTAMIGYHLKSDASETRLELFRLIGDWKLHLTQKDYSADRYASTMGAMSETAGRFYLRGADSRPDRAGFAVTGGYFADPPKPSVWEEFVLTLKFPDHPDARFFLSSRAISQEDKEEPSLATRASLEIRMLRENAPGLKVLGKESRKVADQKGYWVGISAPYDAGSPDGRLRKFFWSAEGVPNDVTRPFLEMELMIEPTAEAGNTFKDDKAAQDFFDQILDSLKIRPGAV